MPKLGYRFALFLQAFLKLSATLDGCGRSICVFVNTIAIGAKTLLSATGVKRLVSHSRTTSKQKRVSPGQQ